mmetsp:Transcript_1140/g.3149  ORF Transcript_1140/g.3149 Transcript_1140/m.3149 type:complete len:729 (-) Transcript_1140:4-2190(-)
MVGVPNSHRDLMFDAPKSGAGAHRRAANASKASADTGAPLREAEESLQQKDDIRALSEAIAAAEREGGYPAVIRVFESHGEDLPPSLSWKIHLELAECAKRGAALPQMKYHLAQALQAQPYVVQVWLEISRTLDELGELAECRALLERGLECCPLSEQLALKLVRVLERLGDLPALRSLVGALRKDPPERTCKVLLEAAQVEVRAGSGHEVRSLLRCLMLRMPHLGTVFCEACRVENILGNLRTVLSIAEHGVQTCLKYGPLWFVLVRQAERVYGARAVKDYADLALRNVGHELHWKFHFEVAAAFSREGKMQACRQSISAAALSCPRHLRWKVWLLAARSELWDGSVDASRKLLNRARVEAPMRVQAAVYIERARVEEFVGDLSDARAALTEARSCGIHDWKVFLEHIFMEARQGHLNVAKEVAFDALDLHPATGRLWSTLIALEHSGEGGVDGAVATFRKAVREVPKSGEVWCEGARVFMNPLGSLFHVDNAHKCLKFAVHLTPQYGDSFLELLRLRFLLEIRRRVEAEPLTIGVCGTSGSEVQDTARHTVAMLVAQRVHAAVESELQSGRFAFTASTGGSPPDGFPKGEVDDGMPRVCLQQLEVLCTYADPNYGFLWFWCRHNALSQPSEVLHRMRGEIISDLLGRALWSYVWAITRSVFGLPAGGAVAACPGALNPAASTDEPLSSRDFTIGSLRLARCFARGIAMLGEAERRRLIFGSDILCV